MAFLNENGLTRLWSNIITKLRGLQSQITANANAIELLTNGASAEEIDSVNDLIDYVNEHGAEVTGMKADIKANSDAIDALADIASTGNVNDLVQTSGDVIVLDCGTSTINV